MNKSPATFKKTISAWNGSVIADLSVVPIGTGSTSVSKEVAQVERILQRFPVRTSLHANGTNIEGTWDDVSSAIKAIHTELHESGVSRIYCNMRWGSRTDKTQSMEDKIEKVQSILGSGL
jgi:uncharacterized protein (TIGR00106 family)